MSLAENAVNVGVAAHITAASPGGPRFDAALSTAERCHFSNGIWLCEVCAKLIDTDVARFPTSTLKEWKLRAEDSARREMGRPKVISKGKFALISQAQRFGADTNVLVGEHPIALARVLTPEAEQYAPTLFFGEAYVLRFKIQKRKRYKYVVLDELQVVVYKREEIPQYRPLFAAYPAKTMLYRTIIEPPLDDHPRKFVAETLFEGETDKTCKSTNFVPLVLDDDVPATISLRIDCRTTGLYWISVGAVVSKGLRQEGHIVLRKTPVIFETRDPELDLMNRGGMPFPG